MNLIDAWIVEESCCDGHYLMTVATEAEAKRVCEFMPGLNYYQQSIHPFTDVEAWIEEQLRAGLEQRSRERWQELFAQAEERKSNAIHSHL